jgi:dinuclear metal center YbgI/SA1388 family protein
VITADRLAEYLDGYLRTSEIPDHAHALNGLQLSRQGEIRKVALAVDAAQVSIDSAIDEGADFLVVHHGLFWDGLKPLTGRSYHRIRALMAANIGVYSSHLPLDIHPVVGNNVCLARALGVGIEGPFGNVRGVEVGLWGQLEMRREALAARLDQVLGCRVRMIAGGPERVRRVGIITGGAGGQVDAARAAGLDAFITGEAAHHNYFDAAEGGINLYLGGHYATEVWGVRALASHLAEHFGVETVFLDHPTGL